MDTRIYVMTHKKLDVKLPEPYIPLHAGRACGEDFGYLGDDTGDQISEKNPAYCELTGMYWLWKNVNCDIIGICHYRRFFTKENRLLSREYIERTVEKRPVMIPNSACVDEKDAYAHYAKKHYAADLDVCRTVIGGLCPEYLNAFDFVMRTKLVSMGNMWITRKDIFDRYCEWLFPVLFEAEKRIHTEGYDNYQKRVMGFLAERLFRVWLFMQKEPVTEEHVERIESQEFLQAERKEELLFRYVKLKISPLLRLYQTGGMQETPAGACPDSFGGKIPVWVFYPAGGDKMPETVRFCIRSIQENIPAEKTVFCLLTLENCMQYASFTDEIIRKFNEGKIGDAQLAEILKAELLFRYGGMWIDPSYYAAGKISDEIFRQPVYTLRYQNPDGETNPAEGRWSADFWYAEKGNQLFLFLMEGMWYYWETENEWRGGTLTDYLTAAAVEEFTEIRQELERCAYCGTEAHKLHEQMNRKYSKERLMRLEKENTFYKLHPEAAYRKENMAGEETVYGYLCRRQ